MHDQRRVLRIDKEGEGPVTAGDIRAIDGVEILNPAPHRDAFARRQAAR